ncbi:MAG: hypothetical protein WBX07_05725, partial [Rhodoplanes sp.]
QLERAHIAGDNHETGPFVARHQVGRGNGRASRNLSELIRIDNVTQPNISTSFSYRSALPCTTI